MNRLVALLTAAFLIMTAPGAGAQALSASSGCMDLFQSCAEMERPHTAFNAYNRAECTGYIAGAMAAWLSTPPGFSCLRNIPNGTTTLQLSMIYLKWVRDNPATARGLGSRLRNRSNEQGILRSVNNKAPSTKTGLFVRRYNSNECQVDAVLVVMVEQFLPQRRPPDKARLGADRGRTADGGIVDLRSPIDAGRVSAWL